MTAAQKIAVRLSQVRERLNAIGQLEGDGYTDEIRSEESTLQTEYGDLERRHRSALIAEGEGETRPADPDAEQRGAGRVAEQGQSHRLPPGRPGGPPGGRRRGRIAGGRRDRRRRPARAVGRSAAADRASRRRAHGSAGHRRGELGSLEAARVRQQHRPPARHRDAASDDRLLRDGHHHNPPGRRQSREGQRVGGDGRGLHGVHRDAEKDFRPARNPHRGRGRRRSSQLRAHPARESGACPEQRIGRPSHQRRRGATPGRT